MADYMDAAQEQQDMIRDAHIAAARRKSAAPSALLAKTATRQYRKRAALPFLACRSAYIAKALANRKVNTIGVKNE